MRAPIRGKAPRTYLDERHMTSPNTRWARQLTRYLWLTDLTVITLSVLAAHLFRLGDDLDVATGIETELISYWLIGAGIIGAWMLVLRLTKSRSPHILGFGPEEFVLCLTSALWVLGLISFVSFALRLGIARGYVAVAVPVGAALLLVSRWGWRRWLNHRRAEGRHGYHVLVVATISEAEAVRRHLTENRGAGLIVTDVLPPQNGAVDITAIASRAQQANADAVLLGLSSRLEPGELRDLIWMLADSNCATILASGLTGITGPRAHSRPIEGLPLWQVEPASYTGSMSMVKAALDRFSALVLLVLLSPLILGVSVAIRLDSPGPVFFKQVRIGQDGVPFDMWKFRSMRVGAADELDSLLVAQRAADQPLFKIQDDPRITKVGRFIRRYSIDELPQLFNVVRGEMSLVGPRPQVPREVALYDSRAIRRLRARPGITGLWQVSGRSDVAWHEAVMLDLHYVDNWSLTLDAVLLWRTVAAVLTARGAR